LPVECEATVRTAVELPEPAPEVAMRLPPDSVIWLLLFDGSNVVVPPPPGCGSYAPRNDLLGRTSPFGRIIK
jgi:hypothetical protein